MPESKMERRYIWVDFNLKDTNGSYFPEIEETIEAIEEQINERSIGFVDGGGSDGDRRDFSFLVKNETAVEAALEALKALLKEHNITSDTAAIWVSKTETFLCDETPIFKSGDCLSLRLKDGDYGGIVVLLQYNDQDDNLCYEHGTVTSVYMLNYKQSTPPTLEDFKTQQWLLWDGGVYNGQPILTDLFCYEAVSLQQVGRISIALPDNLDTSEGSFWCDVGLGHFFPHKLMGDYDVEEQSDDDDSLTISW